MSERIISENKRKTEMENKRCYKIDNIKAILMILVVVGHFVDLYALESDFYKSIYVCIYAFHMPLFIFISGMFYKHEKAKINFAYYLILGLALRYLIDLCIMIMYPEEFRFVLFEESSIPWFLFALSAYSIMSLLLKKVNKTLILIISIILSCLAGYVDFIDDFFVSSRIIVFFPFFILGQMVSLEKILYISEKLANKLASWVILIVWSLLCFAFLYNVYIFRQLFTGRNPYYCNELFLTWGGAYRFAAYLISALTSVALLIIVPDKKLPLISDWGKRTLQVLLFHYPLQLIIMSSGIGDKLVTTYLGKLAWIMIGVLLSTALFMKIWTRLTESMNYLIKEKLIKNIDS